MKMKISSNFKHFLGVRAKIPFDLMLRPFSFNWPKDQVFGFKEKYLSLINNIFF